MTGSTQYYQGRTFTQGKIPRHNYFYQKWFSNSNLPAKSREWRLRASTYQFLPTHTVRSFRFAPSVIVSWSGKHPTQSLIRTRKNPAMAITIEVSDVRKAISFRSVRPWMPRAKVWLSGSISQIDLAWWIHQANPNGLLRFSWSIRSRSQMAGVRGANP